MRLSGGWILFIDYFMKALSHLCLLALLFLILPIVLATTIDLPNIVAIHFNSFGVPDGWASSYEFRAGMIIFTGFINLMLVSLFTGINFIPLKYVSLPNKEYWFHADRRKQAMLHIYENGLWMTIVFNLFCTLLIMLIADANGRIPVKLDLYVMIMGIIFFAGGLIYIAARIYQTFLQIPCATDRGEA